MVVFRET